MSERTPSIPRRAYARWTVSLAARVEAGAALADCRVIDVSVGGARIEPAVGFAPGAAVVLDLLAYGRLPALVAWSSPTHSGLRFTVSNDQVAEALQAIALYSGPGADEHDAVLPSLRYTAVATVDTADTPPLQVTQAENRDLRATIAELRENLETIAEGRRQAVQQAQADSQDDIRQLEGTITAMREQLEQVNYDHSATIEQVRVESRDEIAQLKTTVGTLRDELEHQRLRHDDNVQALERAFAHERAQLMETIAVLRTRLEQCIGQGNH